MKTWSDNEKNDGGRSNGAEKRNGYDNRKRSCDSAGRTRNGADERNSAEKRNGADGGVSQQGDPSHGGCAGGHQSEAGVVVILVGLLGPPGLGRTVGAGNGGRGLRSAKSLPPLPCWSRPITREVYRGSGSST